jgi:hypothetical protein
VLLASIPISAATIAAAAAWLAKTANPALAVIASAHPADMTATASLSTAVNRLARVPARQAQHKTAGSDKPITANKALAKTAHKFAMTAAYSGNNVQAVLIPVPLHAMMQAYTKAATKTATALTIRKRSASPAAIFA